jgi:hypothetical protein
MSSNSTQGMDVRVPLFCVCVALCVGSGLATRRSLVLLGLLFNPEDGCYIFLRNVRFSPTYVTLYPLKYYFSLPDLLEPQILLRIIILFVLPCSSMFYLRICFHCFLFILSSFFCIRRQRTEAREELRR